MSRSLYVAADDDPVVRYEADEREQVLAQIRQVMAERGLSRERAIRAVLGAGVTEAALAWLGGQS
ncbi:MAG TPA: hypothetical protein VFS67_35570 [Polyangiaceae bacterium]|nr:hypothetical protein [Polyangiaceae bacterium]